MNIFFERWRVFFAVAVVLSSTLMASCSGCGRASKQGVFIDPAFGPVIPPDTRFMAGVRLDKIRNTPFYKRLNSSAALQRHLDLFSQRTGLDPRKDLWQVLFVSNGRQSLVFARGRFTEGEMEPKLGALGSERQHYKNYTLIGNPQTSVVFLNPGVAVAGSQPALKSLLDHRSEYRSIPASFSKKLASLPADDQVWAIDEGALRQLQGSGPDTTGMRSMLENLIGFVNASSVGAHIDEGATVRAEVECVSTDGAQRVRDALKGAVGLARLNTRSDQMGILRLYDAIKIDQTDNRVTVAAEIAPDLAQQFLTAMPELRNRPDAGFQQLLPQ